MIYITKKKICSIYIRDKLLAILPIKTKMLNIGIYD